MEGGPTIPHLGMSRPKRREPTAPAANTVLPTELQVDDRLADESGAWEVVSRPYTTAGGKTAHVRVKRGRPTRQRRRAELERVSSGSVSSQRPPRRQAMMRLGRRVLVALYLLLAWAATASAACAWVFWLEAGDAADRRSPGAVARC
jgi:hypothetical protein